MATNPINISNIEWRKLTAQGETGTCWKKTGGPVVVCQTDQETDLFLPLSNINVSLGRSKRVPLDIDSGDVLDLPPLSDDHVFYGISISDILGKIVVDAPTKIVIPSGVQYDLKALFTGPNTTFNDTDVIPSPYVETGILTVVDTSTGTAKIVGNELELVGNGASWTATGVIGAAVSRSLGKAGFITLNNTSTTSTNFVGFYPSAAIGTNPSFAAYTSSQIMRYRHANSSGAIATIPKDVDYSILLLAGGYDSSGIPFVTGDTIGDFLYGFRFFIKGGTFTSWTLLWSDENRNDATLYYYATNFQVTGATLDNLLIPTEVLNVDTMFPPAYLATTPDLNVNDIGISDAFIDTSITTPGAGTDVFQIRFRYQDSSNFWNVKITAGTAGADLSLHKTTGGVEGAALATADIDWAVATAYDVRIIVDGNDDFRVYVDSALELTYTGPDSAFLTETEVQLVDGASSYTANLFSASNRRNSAWDTEISSATEGIY